MVLARIKAGWGGGWGGVQEMVGRAGEKSTIELTPVNYGRVSQSGARAL